MNKNGMLAVLAIVSVACSKPAPTELHANRFDIDPARITVSGVSAGAYMAGQIHIAHSATIAGAGLIAGGPYGCASGSMQQALGPCMNGGDIDVQALAQNARDQANEQTIDALENLVGDRVWVFHGANDTIVNAAVPAAAIEFYADIAATINVTSVADIGAPHGMPTIGRDESCATVATPFLNACDFDAAGELLKVVANISNDRIDQPEGELRRVAQPGATAAAMLDEALLFVPAACADGQTCGLHIDFHGCQQSSEFVGEAYALGAGYNEWAASNNLLVLYPQVARSRVAPLNPLGCWDWWGYTGAAYATRAGAQISVVKSLIDTLSGADH